MKSVWGGAAEGTTVRILGERFGEHALDINAGQWIETNAAGTTFDRLEQAPGWGIGQATPRPAVITDERAHSGSQSVLARIVRAEGYWQSVMKYRHPTPVKEFFISFWYWFDPIATSDTGYTQHKWFRLGDDDVSNSCAEIYALSRWVGDEPGVATANVYCADLGDNRWNWDTCYASIFDREAEEPLCQSCQCGKAGPNFGSCAGQSAKDNLPTPRQWTRIVIHARASDLDTPNGELFLSIHKPQRRAEVAVDWRGIVTHASDCTTTPLPWQHFQLQNYFADSKSGDQSIRGDFFYDDLYIQVGTQARVELGDAANYDACTQLETQVPTSWDAGEIVVNLRHGGFAVGDKAWLFVTDADGRTSRGLPITLK